MRTALALLVSMAAGQAGEAITCIGVDPADLPQLAAATQSLELLPAPAADFAAATRLTLYEASGPAADRATVERLAVHLARGNALCVTLARKPGKAAFALTPVMPTSAWQTLLPEAHRGEADGPVDSGPGDGAFFAGLVPTISLPWYWRLKTVHAVERGESRYEVMARTQSYLAWPLRPGEPFLSRPLLNRDWQVRLEADDGRGSGLLITGSYGAGRVAVLACAASEVPAVLWAATWRWLAGARPGEAPVQVDVQPTATIDAGSRALVVSARNPGAVPLLLPVVARLSTGDNALFCDIAGTLTLAAGTGGTLRLPLPALLSVGPEQLKARVGVLSPDARALWWEGGCRADLRPAVRLAVTTDELRAVSRGFQAPGPDRLKLPDRGGARVAAYARKPGEAVQAWVQLDNAADNLALLATVVALDGTGATGLVALTDGLASRAGPRDSYQYWGRWSGEAGKDQAVVFRFAKPVTITRVVLWGDTAGERDGNPNPGAAVLMLDGREELRADDLDERFAAGLGQAELVLAAPAQVSELVLRLPWMANVSGGGKRGAPRLGEVEILGCTGELPGPRTVRVRLALSGAGSRHDLGDLTITARGADRAEAALSFTLPDAAPVAWRVVATAADMPEAECPLLAIDPAEPLRSTRELEAQGLTYETGTIVTRGVRTYLPYGTGSRDTTGNWGEPEDLVFCYARNLKQTAAGARTQAGKLYLSEHDFRHYVNPWTSLPSGELFFRVAAPAFVERSRGNKRFDEATTVQIFHSDRWDTGPSVANLYTWQELVAFDRWLGEQGLPRLSGRTREAVTAEILAAHEPRLRAWQLQRYLDSVRALKGAVEGAGKRLVLRGQGIPLVPLAALDELASTYRGMSDDNTWGARGEDYAFTAGVQMAIKAFNPSWQLNSNLCWGWDSAILSNPHWYSPVGITETSRRHAAIRAWRGCIGIDGTYRSMFTFGFGMNGYAPFTVTTQDWQENWNAAERWSLLVPDGPIGAGVVISTGRLDDPARTMFSGGGMGGSGEADHLAEGIARTIGRLHHAGISVPFAANATCVDRWQGSAPLICLDVGTWTEAERAMLRTWTERGIPLVLFGAEADAGATDAGFSIGGKPVLAIGKRIFVSASHEQLTIPEVNVLAALMHRISDLPLQFPPGIAGYGFTMAGRRVFTVEDWAERGGEAEVRLRAIGASATATALTTHRPLAMRRDGRDWLITVPLHPADGDVVLVEDTP